MICKISREGPW